MASKKRKRSEQRSSEEDLKGLLQRLINKVTQPTVPVLFSTPADLDWISPPFYTHPRGYNMKLVISYRRDYGSTATVATPDKPFGCYAKFILLKGEYDDYLRFPIRMAIELHVMKKATNESRSVPFRFDDNTSRKCTERWMDWSNTDVRLDQFKEVLLLKKDEMNLFSIDNFLTFKITKVETNVSCDYATESKTASC